MRHRPNLYFKFGIEIILFYFTYTVVLLNKILIYMRKCIISIKKIQNIQKLYLVRDMYGGAAGKEHTNEDRMLASHWPLINR
jgi:hypothetical protein